MPPSHKPHDVTLRVVPRIAEVDRAAWDACANPPERPFDPFVTHAFLDALEQSGSATTRTGWAPQHLMVEDKSGAPPSAVMPLYLKSHSQGEYIFDHSWADAFERAGGRYYPKLLCAVPFTPATGPRLLVRPGAKNGEEALIAGAVTLAEQHDISSLNINFPTRAQWERLGQMGFLQRTGEQFHWENEGYKSFDEFLSALVSRKRKQIKKERREAVADGIKIRWLTGRDLTEAAWDAFFHFYMDTGGRKWGHPYLTRAFFSLVGQSLAEHILLVLCERDGQPVAGALNFIGGDTLYGRYWGCSEQHAFLHFEACYYQAIDYAIAKGLKRVEAGAQGPHKLVRGYKPTAIYSAHWIADPNFRQAVERFLESERHEIARHIDMLSDYVPFRREEEPQS